MDKCNLIKLINDRYPKYLPDGFTLVVTQEDAHIFEHKETGMEGWITDEYWSLKDEVESLRKSKDAALYQLKQAEKERVEVEKAIQVLRGQNHAE